VKRFKNHDAARPVAARANSAIAAPFNGSLTRFRERVRPMPPMALGLLMAVTAYGLCLAETPVGWFLGSPKDAYSVAPDATDFVEGARSAVLHSTQEHVDGFGTLGQISLAKTFRGKRVRFSASVKSTRVEKWAGLWMRCDRTDGSNSAFDNMEFRPIKSHADWQRYEVVLDVPRDTNALFYGLLLVGAGAVWLDDAKIEVVDHSVRVTGGPSNGPGSGPPRVPIPDAPTNLDLEQWPAGPEASPNP
jgi:hypothetical protein